MQSSTPLQNFFSAPQHTMRSPHYHHAPRSARIALSSRVTHPRGRRRDRYRRLENDLKKVYGKPSARKHGGRSYNIGANNGSKPARTRPHTHAPTRPRTHARTRTRARAATWPRGQQAQEAHCIWVICGAHTQYIVSSKCA